MTELTMEDIKEACKCIQKYDTCEKCDTLRDYMVIGFGLLYCKCEAKELAKTPYSKYIQTLMREILK